MRALTVHRRAAWRLSRCAAPAAALALVACAVGPNYHRPPAPVPSAYKELPPGWKVAAPQDEKRRGDWWAIFEDPELDRLERQVNISNYYEDTGRYFTIGIQGNL